MAGYQNTEGAITLVAGEALEAFRRVKINTSGQSVYADAQDRGFGVTLAKVLASGDPAPIMPYSGAASLRMTAAGVLTAGEHVYAAADGKVDDAATGVVIGVTTEAATGDGSQVEILPVPPANIVQLTHTVTAGEDTANSATIDTGLGVVLDWAIVQVRTAAGVARTATTVTFGSGGNAGQITVAESNLAATDVIYVIAGYGVQAI